VRKTQTGAALAALALLALVAVVSASQAASAATWTVEMRNLEFQPRNITIVEGDTIEWVNEDSFGHDVNATLAGADSGATAGIAPGATYSFTFTAVGDFPYQCDAHAPLMVGRITVLDASLVPAVTVDPPPATPVQPGAVVTLSGTAQDAAGVTGVLVSVDGGAAQPAQRTQVTPGDDTSVTWTYNLSTAALNAGEHTVAVHATNPTYSSSPLTVTLTIAGPAGGPPPPGGNPFGESFLFEDIMTKYFWLITGVTVVLLAVVLLFMSYSGKLQNYYIALLTALDERHRLFAYTRPTREFIYTIQRQMPRTHTERYNLKVIWYWYPLYCLGGLAFASFIILTITGIILGFYYIPEGTGPNDALPSDAYHSMEVIMTQVTFGYIFRALHHWGAHMMIATVFLHMMRVYFVGAYKNPRELNWLLGVTLLLITLLFGYTGYLLPWDQLAYWAGTIGLGMSQSIPVIGDLIGNMLFGGPELSGATIIRMYYLHVFVLPLIGGALMVLHMGIVWMQGVAEPH